MLFPKAPASYCKTILNEFLLQCTSICISSKIVSDFKNLFQTGNINIFVLRGVLFSRYVQLKSLFSDEKKNQQRNLRHALVEKLLEINVAKY